MINYFRREFAKLFLSVIVIICVYNSVNLTFFNEKSVTKIFELNENILLLKEDQDKSIIKNYQSEFELD